MKGIRIPPRDELLIFGMNNFVDSILGQHLPLALETTRQNPLPPPKKKGAQSPKAFICSTSQLDDNKMLTLNSDRQSNVLIPSLEFHC